MDNIPPQHPENPRWLLDLHTWTLCEYQNIADLEANGYGIISYTWGLYRDGNKTVNPKLLPQRIPWRVPALKKKHNNKTVNITLKRARAAMETMQLKYVWWDWMCVPQGQNLSQRYKDAAAEEIAKQMHIYRNARDSIVWMHDTAWSRTGAAKNSPAIEKLLTLNRTPPSLVNLEGTLSHTPPSLNNFEAFVNTITGLVEECRLHEPWLTSIWTLQEGVILQETRLLDCDAKELRDERFFHRNRATVQDLTVHPTYVATNITDALLHINEEPPHSSLVEHLRWSPQLRLRVQIQLARLVKSGLVGYVSGHALFILAGKQSRRVTPDNLDNYWALVGALDLQNVAVSYDIPKNEARTIFFNSLLQKHQWQLFMVASLPNSLRRLPWPEVISDGYMFPLGMYFGINLLSNLPEVLWESSGITVRHSNETEVSVLAFQNYTCRRYEQQQRPDGLPLITVLGPGEFRPESDTVYLHVATLESREKIEGKRCIEIKEWKTEGTSSRGYFNGVVDIWASGNVLNVLKIRDIRLDLQISDPGSRL